MLTDTSFVEPTPEAEKPKERPLEFETTSKEGPAPLAEGATEELPLQRKEVEVVLDEGRFTRS